MPSRQKKSKRGAPPEDRAFTQSTSATSAVGPHNRMTPKNWAGHGTRINAFVTSQGRRNQARRDAR